MKCKSPFECIEWQAPTPVSCMEISLCLSKQAFRSFARVDYQTDSDHIAGAQLSTICASNKLQAMCKTHAWHAQSQHHKQLQQGSLPLNPSSIKVVPACVCYQVQYLCHASGLLADSHSTTYGKVLHASLETKDEQCHACRKGLAES